MPTLPKLRRLRKPCLTIDQCAQALSMESLGFTSRAIAKSFGVSRENLIITLQYAKEYGFLYFSYQGGLIDHVQTLRAIGAKQYSYGIYEKFCALTGLEISRMSFTRAIVKIRPYL